MKVLVTGGTGGFGMTVCRQLARAGADPIAMARNEPAVLPPGVRFTAGDIRDADAIARAMNGCDAVVHLAWYMGVGGNEEVDKINIGGTKNVLDAMERSGVRRLVFTSSTTTYGAATDHPMPFREDDPLRPSESFRYPWQKAQVEAEIASRDIDAVVARVTVLLGREVDNEPSQVYALPALMNIGRTSVVQAVHQDDVGRFIERAALGDWVGTVNLASPGSVPMDLAGELLERRVLHVPLGVSLRAGKIINRLGVDAFDEEVALLLAHWPVADTTRLTEEWGFRPAWSQEDILRDQARSASRRTYVAPGASSFSRPRRLAWASTTPADPRRLRPGAEVRHAAPEGVRGSLDTPIDPTYPVYSATNLSEAFPGPMTPLSLDLAVDGMSSATDGLVQLFGMEGEVATLMRLGLGTFAHSVYVNVSTARLMADFVPGATVEQVDRMYLGIDAPPGPKQRIGPKEVLTGARLGARIAPKVAGMRAEVERLVADVATVTATDVVSLTDDQLLSHLMLVHDLVCQSWNTSSTGNFLLSGLTSALEGQEQTSSSASAATLRGVQRLAALVRADTALRDQLAGDLDGALARVEKETPAFAAAFAQLIAECGHRGPGETELENDTFADRPELLLDVIRRTAARPAEAASSGSTGRRSPLARFARRVLEDKERARDTGVRAIHAFRVAVRERAQRLVEDGKLADAADVFYCTYEELLSVSQPPSTVLDGRREERARLANYRMPLSFDGSWESEDVDAAAVATVGTVLTGVAAVDGVHEGIARVMVSPTDDLEPDDVLVTATTDIGWTPYFALAGAIVTDIGGVASHAAIVAREHGIPSVVGVGDATQRLRSGMRVRVDGAAGTIEVLEL